LGAHCDIGAVEATRLSLSVGDGDAYAFYGKTVQYVVTLQTQRSSASRLNPVETFLLLHWTPLAITFLS